MDSCEDYKIPIHNLERRRKRLRDSLLMGREADLPARLAEILDEYFLESFSQSVVGPTLHLENNPCAFIALGGYGRREQCLHSDVDILLLFRKHVPAKAEALLHEIVFPLWDLGFEVGHATRTLRECRNQASEDFAILTSLLDARFLCGFSPLYGELTRCVRDGVLKRHKCVYIDWLIGQSRDRHKRFGDSSFLLEPNIKEGQGGLRDFHAIGWMSLARYLTRDMEELLHGGHVTGEERIQLRDALRFIWNVRNRLHDLTGRKCDRLHFDVQVEMAHSMGFRDRNGRRAVEHYLGTLHGHMESIKRLHLGLVNQVTPQRTVSFRRGPSPRLRTNGLKWLRGMLSFESAESIKEDPLLLTRIFVESATLGVPLSLEAIRLIRERLARIDKGSLASPEAIQDLRAVLKAPSQTCIALREMFQTGLMTALIPELNGIINLVQHDAYHVYPVDLHSLRTVEILMQFDAPESNHERDPAFNLLREISNPEPLLWAALLHDVGKGEAVQDHAVRGARIAREVFTRMLLPEEHVERISFLVREHLSLYKTATQRDIQEEKTVVRFARKFRNTEELTMLYLLTVADAMATGPKAFGGWVETLLQELYFKTRHVIEKGDLAYAGTAEIMARKKKEILEKTYPGTACEMEILFENMPPRYLLHTSSDEVLRHVDLYRRLDRVPFVLEVQKAQTEYRTVTFCARDRPGLFSRISGAFVLNNLDILQANIHTWTNQVAVDIFVVKPPKDSLREEETWNRMRRDLQAVLAGTLDLEMAIADKMRFYKTPPKGGVGRPPRVIVDNEASDFFTIIEVYAHDSPGLLYRITHALLRLELDVRIAKITTKVDQVLDIFYVCDIWGQKVAEEDKVRAIEAFIHDVLLP